MEININCNSKKKGGKKDMANYKNKFTENDMVIGCKDKSNKSSMANYKDDFTEPFDSDIKKCVINNVGEFFKEVENIEKHLDSVCTPIYNDDISTMMKNL